MYGSSTNMIGLGIKLVGRGLFSVTKSVAKNVSTFAKRDKKRNEIHHLLLLKLSKPKLNKFIADTLLEVHS